MSIPQGGFSGWIYQTLNFVATSAIQTLSFNAIGTGQPPFIALDGVSVVQVPEPGTWLLVGGGLLALTFARRRFARRV